MRIIGVCLLLCGCTAGGLSSSEALPDASPDAAPAKGAGLIEVDQAAPSQVWAEFDEDVDLVDFFLTPASCQTFTIPYATSTSTTTTNQLLDPGAITVDDASSALTFTRDAFGQLVGGSPGSFVVAPGESVTFRTTGGVVPAFEASLAVPPAIVMTPPEDAAQPTFDRTQDLELTSAPVAGITLHVTLSSPTAGLECDVPATGHVSLPSHELAKFPAGPAKLYVTSFQDLAVDTGGVPVTLRTTTNAVGADGNRFEYALELE